MRVVEPWHVANARRTVCEEKLKEEEEYMEKMNERLRVMVVLEGRERLKQLTQATHLHKQFSGVWINFASGEPAYRYLGAMKLARQMRSSCGDPTSPYS
jgi:hypothetical protein